MSSTNFSLVHALNQHVLRGRFHRPVSGYFRPTEASVVTQGENGPEVVGDCLRKVWYRQKGIPQGPQSANLYLAWSGENGNWVETGVGKLLKEMGIWRAEKVPFIIREHNVQGELDFVIQEPGFSQESICECKSFFGYAAAKHILGSKRPPRKGRPKDNHLLQASLYLYFFRDQIARTKLYYFARDSSQHTEFNLIVRPDDSGQHRIYLSRPWEESYEKEQRFTIEDILARYQQLALALKGDIPPTQDFQLTWTPEQVVAKYKEGEVSKTKFQEWEKGKTTLGHWMCKRCPWSVPCWNLETPPQEEEENAQEVAE